MSRDQTAPNGVEAARTICLNMLAARPRTRSELSTRLAARGIADDVIGQILDRLGSAGLVDDASYAAAFVAGHSRGLSRGELVRRLEQKGVDRQISLDATGHIDTGSERAMAAGLVASKLRAMSDVDEPAKTRRLVAMLARRGFGSAICYSVVREVCGEFDDQFALQSE
jgi:regulatory protein